MRLVQTGSIRGDETAPYVVYDYKAITASDFVSEVLREFQNDWGYIEVNGFGRVEYRYGELLGEIPERWGHLTVVKVDASGGWSRIDYRIQVNPKVDYYRLYQK